MTYFKYLIIVLACFALVGCGIQAQEKGNTAQLLTAHKWQLIAEKGLHLPEASLKKNIIELKSDGKYLYYQQTDKLNLFTENQWSLSPDGQFIIEKLQDNRQIQSKILEITDSSLKIQYEEKTGTQKSTIITETYQKFE
jgi:hypothetical protein